MEQPEEAAFRALKSLVMSAPILVLPDQGARFRLKTDASGYVTRAILSQLRDDEKWHPVGFTSKSLSPVERNYSEQQNRSHVWKFWIVHLIEDRINFQKSEKYSDIWPNIPPMW